MRRDLQDRREKTFDLLVNKGVPYGKVVERIATQYDISESGVESDINRMDDWLPKLVDETDHSRKDGKVRLKELKSNRERLQQMAMEARRDDNLDRELAIRRKIEDSIELEVALRQSLGHMEREPTAMENAMSDFATGAMRVEFPDEDDSEEPESEST